MLPYINIFNEKIPTYGLTIVIGVILGVIVATNYFSKFYKISKEDVLNAYLYGIIGLIVGAKLLYLIVNIPYIFENKYEIIQKLILMINGGFVFYGGLIGGILGLYIYSKIYKVSFKELLLIIVPTVPLVHSVDRIACLLAGCCYGVPYNGIFSIVFYISDIAPKGVQLFPVQILERMKYFIQ